MKNKNLKFNYFFLFVHMPRLCNSDFRNLHKIWIILIPIMHMLGSGCIFRFRGAGLPVICNCAGLRRRWTACAAGYSRLRWAGADKSAMGVCLHRGLLQLRGKIFDRGKIIWTWVWPWENFYDRGKKNFIFWQKILYSDKKIYILTKKFCILTKKFYILTKFWLRRFWIGWVRILSEGCQNISAEYKGHC